MRNMVHRHLPLLIYLACFAAFLIHFNLNRPRVMILHSYHLEYAWVRDLNEGLNRVLAKRPYLIRWHYLDTKRNPYPEYKERAGRAARREIERWRPDVLIAADDNAQEYVSKYFTNDPHLSIVFLGVQTPAETYFQSQLNKVRPGEKVRNVCGIYEWIPIQAVKEALQIIRPAGRLAQVVDDSETSRAVQKELLACTWQPLRFTSSMCETFEQWKALVEKANTEADLLFLTQYHTLKRSDSDLSVVPNQEAMAWALEHSRLPIVSCWGFVVEDGAALAIAVSPFEQGEVAGQMAADIIEGRRTPVEIGCVNNRQVMVYMRGRELKRHGIQLPGIYEAFARATSHYFD
jgi:ABC-type uncharacterized transport system substrate-binding protein